VLELLVESQILPVLFHFILKNGTISFFASSDSKIFSQRRNRPSWKKKLAKNLKILSGSEEAGERLNARERTAFFLVKCCMLLL